jgi:phage recombination protein Bet
MTATPATPVTPVVAFTPDDLAAIGREILKPRNRYASVDEVRLFAKQCERTGLDPFAGQIYAQFRTTDGQEGMTVQATIDGFRVVAERSGAYAGQTGPFWYDKARGWIDVWLSGGSPVAAKVVVRKVIAGHLAETSAVAHFDEYAQRKSGGALTRSWATMPALMLAKCAEALALRKAFPNVLSGIYTADEMGRVDEGADVPFSGGEAPVIAPAPSGPTAGDGVPVGRASDVTTPQADPARDAVDLDDVIRESTAAAEAEAVATAAAPVPEHTFDGETLLREIGAYKVNAETFRRVCEVAGVEPWPDARVPRSEKAAYLDRLPSDKRLALAQAIVVVERERREAAKAAEAEAEAEAPAAA